MFNGTENSDDDFFVPLKEMRAGIGTREGQLTYQISAPVQADKTGPAIAALIADYREFLGSKGVTGAELARVQSGATRELPGAFQTAKAVMSALQENDLFGRLDDYYSRLPAKVRAQYVARLDAAARGAIDPARFAWVVVGDAAKIRPQLEGLGLPVEVTSAECAARRDSEQRTVPPIGGATPDVRISRDEITTYESASINAFLGRLNAHYTKHPAFNC